MRPVRSLFFLASLLTLTLTVAVTVPVPAEAAPAVPAVPPPPKRATRVLVKKSAHSMTLLGRDDEVLGTYQVSIGPGGSGFKRREGDMVTPVGRYHITMHQPSRFKIFLRLDYPNAQDWERFKELKRKGALPDKATIGGDIGIHGGTPPTLKTQDWTLGCVAVDDEEIVEIARAVPDGVVVDIED
jgi:murein L,D-transpeptidase YafK